MQTGHNQQNLNYYDIDMEASFKTSPLWQVNRVLLREKELLVMLFGKLSPKDQNQFHQIEIVLRTVFLYKHDPKKLTCTLICAFVAGIAYNIPLS